MAMRFSFDPGSDSLGWAVFSDKGGQWSAKACGTVLFRQPSLERLRTGGPAARDRGLRRARKRRTGLLRAACRLLVSLGLLPEKRELRAALFAGHGENPDALHLAGRDVFRLARRRGAPCCRTCPQLCFGSEEVIALCARRKSRENLAEIWGRLPAGADAGNRRAELDILLFGHRPPREHQKPRRRDPALRRALAAARSLLDALAKEHGIPEMIACEAAMVKENAGRPKGREGRLALWRKAAERTVCAYSGAPISRAMTLSRLTEIDHVMPLAASNDMSAENTVLCLASANRAKGGRTPRRAFGGAAQWNGMLERAPPAAIARQLAALELPAGKTGFPDRQANLAAAIGKGLMRLAARRFPQAEPVLVPPLDVARRRGAKDRNDHRHHAMDAVCTGLAAFGIALGKEGLEAVAEPALIERIGLSTRNVRLHEQTVYSLRTPGMIGLRKRLCDLTKRDIAHVCDGALRRQLGLAAAEGLPEGLNRFGEEEGIWRVRIARLAADAIILPANAKGAPARAVLPLAHAHLDIVQGRDGAWRAFAVTRHQAAQRGARPVWEMLGGGVLVMRLRRDDLIELDEGERRTVLRVVRLAAAKSMVWLAEPQAAGNLAARHADPADPFRFQFVSASGLKARRALAVRAGADGEYIAKRSNAACLGKSKASGKTAEARRLAPPDPCCPKQG